MPTKKEIWRAILDNEEPLEEFVLKEESGGFARDQQGYVVCFFDKRKAKENQSKYLEITGRKSKVIRKPKFLDKVPCRCI